MNGHEGRRRNQGTGQVVRSVGEHSGRRRMRSVRGAGASGKENVGMSNDNVRENAHTENPRFPEQR